MSTEANPATNSGNSPAHAGMTPTLTRTTFSRREQPRSRGDDTRSGVTPCRPMGTAPLTRG